MGGVALLARQMGCAVSGSDANVYPPMSSQLQEQGITLNEGYDPVHLDPAPDWVVIGNALSRGNPAVEYVLDRNLNYISGPQFLADHVLTGRWVLAVGGTHGKTTTASMLAWILEYAGLAPGFLIGGVPANFGVTARLGDAPFFAVEADEYDTAFFDKRSKFVHYRPRTLVLNNLEFDHADIFPDLESIKRQFHHLMRIVPASGLVILPGDDANLTDVVARGCWTPTEYIGAMPAAVANGSCWYARKLRNDGSHYEVYWGQQPVGEVSWAMIGDHNVRNALAAIAAARHAGVLPDQALAALSAFKGVKRRLEVRGVVDGVTVYDDFAHHPTEIHSTLEGLRHRVKDGRIVAVLEPRSNTMRLGIHREALAPSLAPADCVVLYQGPGLTWHLNEISQAIGAEAHVMDSIEQIVSHLVGRVAAGDHVVIMSNGAFGGIHQKLIEALERR